MSVLRRVALLEQAQAIDAEVDEPAPPIIIVWPEDETAETRAAYHKADEWYRRHGRVPNDLRVCWSDGTEATLP